MVSRAGQRLLQAALCKRCVGHCILFWLTKRGPLDTQNETRPLYSQTGRTSCNHKELGRNALPSSSPFRCKGRERSLPVLPWYRNNAELLQQAEEVNLHPVLDRLAVGNAKDLDVRDRRMFAR
jgi:hypothetical protein